MNAKVNAIKNLYKHGKLEKEQIRAAVPAVITKEEYEEITGESYK